MFSILLLSQFNAYLLFIRKVSVLVCEQEKDIINEIKNDPKKINDFIEKGLAFNTDSDGTIALLALEQKRILESRRSKKPKNKFVAANIYRNLGDEK